MIIQRGPQALWSITKLKVQNSILFLSVVALPVWGKENSSTNVKYFKDRSDIKQLYQW